MSLGLPANLQGVSILDVGAYEGFYSIQMEQRGALVTANDHFVWNWPGDNSRSNLELAMEITSSKISILEADLDSLPIRKHDVTLFLGVLYHLEDQIGALRRIRETATSVIVLETLVDNLHANGASLKYYPGMSLNNDSSNQFGPNLDALAGLIKAAGFRNYEFKGIWELNPVANHATLDAPLSPLTSGRVVFWLYP
jgi:tRNA (mo5U34)-methyltransferase